MNKNIRTEAPKCSVCRYLYFFLKGGVQGIILNYSLFWRMVLKMTVTLKIFPTNKN